jgi:hypothetical protein
MKLAKPFRMPVIITPDSDVLSVTYTTSPYNRIVVYDALPGSDTAYYGNTVLSGFDRELVRAVSLSLRTSFWQFMSSFLCVDALQPAYLINMPFSFVEGACATAGSYGGGTLLDDRAMLQLLSQAKLEGAFPTWMQAAGSRDIYPGEKLAQAAGSAFAAYLQQRYGMQQYVNYWHAAGDVHMFSLAAGIFETVYNEELSKVWNDFKESVPLPPDLSAMDETDAATTELFPGERDSLASHIVSGPYGTIWYDAARNEVAMLTPEKKKAVLFIATDVSRLSLSADGAYLAVTYRSEGVRSQFVKYKVRIYNVPGRTFLRYTHELRDGSVITYSDGTLAVAGIYTRSQRAELRVYRIDSDADSALLYARAFPEGMIPYLTLSSSKGRVSCLVINGGSTVLFSADCSDGTEWNWTLPYVITDMQYSGASILFSYLPDTAGSFSRLGYVSLDDRGQPVSLHIQSGDVSGGIHSPALRGADIIYSAYKASHFELRAVPLGALSCSEERIEANGTAVPVFAPETVPSVERRTVTLPDGSEKHKKMLGDYDIKGYNPLPYMFRGTWIPMLPLSGFSLDDSAYSLAPGIGLTYLTQSDPTDSTEGVLSFSTAFADPATNYLTFNNNFTLSAYVTNSSLPVDLAAGGTWQVTNSGDYTLQALFGAKWVIPLDMTYQTLSFTAKQLYSVSTSYTDSDTGITEKKSGWTALSEAFSDNRFSLGAAYSNYHQAGISAYEQLGFATGLTLSLDYDSQKVTKDESGSTDPNKISFELDFGFKIPRLLPLPYMNNFVLSLPLTVHSQWYGESGTSCETYAEVLIVGWESQFGIPVVNAYFRRMGLKAGYDLQLTYDTLTLPEPDLRNAGDYFEVLRHASWNDYVYLTTDAVLSPVAGFMTAMQITTGMQYRYYVRKNEFRLAFVINVKM